MRFLVTDKCVIRSRKNRRRLSLQSANSLLFYFFVYRRCPLMSDSRSGSKSDEPTGTQSSNGLKLTLQSADQSSDDSDEEYVPLSHRKNGDAKKETESEHSDDGSDSDYSEDDDSDNGLKKKSSAKSSSKKKRKNESPDDEDSDTGDKERKKKSKFKPKDLDSSVTKGSSSKDSKEKDQEHVWKWWEQSDLDIPDPAERIAPPAASSSDEKAETVAEPVPPVARPAARKPGLADRLSALGKKKESVLTKSQRDWQQLKQDEGLVEELAEHTKSKDSFVERQAFLQRADVRQFEQEKSVRDKIRSRNFQP